MAGTEFLTGKRERMSWVAETSFATGGTMTDGEVVGTDVIITPDFSKGWQEVLSSGDDSLEVADQVVNLLKLPYGMAFSPVNWLWLKYLMAVTDSTDGAVKTHSFAVRNTVESYKLEWAKRHTTSHVITTVGNFVKTATMSFSKATAEGSEGFLNVALACVGQNNSQDSSVTTITAGNITDTPFQYHMAKVTIDDVETVEVNNGEMTIDLGINEDDSRYCNSTLDVKIGEPIPGTFRVNGRFNINIQDKTQYDQWNSGADIGTTITSGTASAGGATTLTDSGEGWTIDAYAGKNVEITAGTGKGQIRNVISNTAEILTVNTAWTTNPDATSVYKVVKVCTLLFDRDGTGNDQILFTYSKFRVRGGVPPTRLEGVTNVDFVWSAKGFAQLVSRDSIAAY